MVSPSFYMFDWYFSSDWHQVSTIFLSNLAEFNRASSISNFPPNVNFNWYPSHFHVLQLFFSFQARSWYLSIFAFFHLNSMIHWNGNILLLTSFFFWLTNTRSSLLIWIGWLFFNSEVWEIFMRVIFKNRFWFVHLSLWWNFSP